MNRKWLGLVVVGAFASTARGALADETGFAVNHFDPSERGSEWFALESLDLRGHLRPAVGVVGDLAYRPLVLIDANGGVVRSVVRNQDFLHAGGSLVVWDRLRLAVSAPVLVHADGFSVNLGGRTYAAPKNSAGVGDVRVGADVRLFGEHGDVMTGAIGVQVALPTGDPASYTGDGNARISPRAMVAGDIGAFTYAARVGTNIRTLDESFAGGHVGTDVSFGASAGLRTLDTKLVFGPEVFGRAVVTGDFLSKRDTLVEGLLGAHYTVGSDFRLGAGISTGLTAGFGTPQLRGLFSAEWAPGIPEPPSDRDHDGIADSEDACADEPGVRTADPKTNGCPSDRDHDGVVDQMDACPDVPGVVTDDPETRGCPSDRDRDGIVDSEDACVDVPGVKTKDPKTNGCPPDRDHDGIVDAQDACIDVPGVKSDEPKLNGCPVDPDRDKDGVPNEADACPDTPGKPDPDPKKNGCPQAFLDSGQIKILEQVKFRTASAVILGDKGTQDILTAVLDVLTQHPEMKHVRIEGHTDDRGAAAMNRKLSQARAASVVKWLVSHGIDKARLTSAGFGPDKPIDSNASEAGRQNNRRVEFHIAD